MYNSYRQAIAGHSLPLAYIDLDLLEENLKGIPDRLSSEISIRVASKSVRVPDILKKILGFSTVYQGIMSYSAAEAAFLLKSGFGDILVAYPTLDERGVNDALGVSPMEVTFMVDSPEHVDFLGRIGRELGVEVNACMDIDLSIKFPRLYFGVYRSPVNSAEKARKLGDYILSSENVVLAGVMGYEAQIAGLPDFSPSRGWLLNKAVQMLKARSLPKIRDRRSDVIKLLSKQGHSLRFVNGGGTGSVESTSMEEVVTEVTVGSGFFSPKLFDYYNRFRHRSAAGFALQITRIPQEGVYTCHGGGYIASGAIGKDKEPVPYLPEGCSLIPDEGAGEVQTPVVFDGELAIGDPIFFRHAKAGELSEHFNEYLLLRDGEVVGSAPTYRGLGQKFL